MIHQYLRARGAGDTTPHHRFTCRGLRECVRESVVVRVSQHGVRFHRVSHFTLAYVYTYIVRYKKTSLKKTREAYEQSSSQCQPRR